MTDREALFRAVLDDPDDDAPRLVYADLLEEQGEPERAELIRVQCRLERLSTDAPDRSHLEARESMILRGRAGSWVLKLGLPGGTWRFRRGLLHFGMMVRNAGRPADLGRAFGWVETLTFRGIGAVGPVLDFVARLPVARLEVIQSQLRDAGAVEIAGSPHLAGLAGLGMWGGGIGSPGARALAESPHLRGLRSLNLAWNQIDADGAEALAAADWPRLESLNLIGNPFGVRGMDLLRQRFGDRVVT